MIGFALLTGKSAEDLEVLSGFVAHRVIVEQQCTERFEFPFLEKNLLLMACRKCIFTLNYQLCLVLFSIASRFSLTFQHFSRIVQFSIERDCLLCLIIEMALQFLCFFNQALIIHFHVFILLKEQQKFWKNIFVYDFMNFDIFHLILTVFSYSSC
jgi:hypothetical protein